MAWEVARGISQEPTQPSKKAFVAICIPHQGNFSAEFSDRVYGPLKYVPTPYFDKTVFASRGTPLDVARNGLVKAALSNPAITHIMFWDDDVISESPLDPNELIFQLLQCNAPIASGSYRARQKHGFNFSMWLKNPNPEGKLEFISIQQYTGNWLKADVIGMGVCLIQRQVFEKVPPPWFVWDDMTAVPSEDFFFCLKCAEYGIESRVFMEAKCSHISGALKVLWSGEITTCDV